MNIEILHKAVNLAERVKHVFVATADLAGLPHIAAAGKLAEAQDEHIAVTEWFCPGTLANLQQNQQIAIVIWDSATDTGYQFLGEVEKIEEAAVMDGYMPDEEKKPPLPQVERRLIVRVDKIVDFSRAPHSDQEVER